MSKAMIFISYAREDERAVTRLYWRLIDVGFQPWMDKFDVLPGEDWRLAIEKAQRAADFQMICLSNASARKRGFVRRELKTALDLRQEKLSDDIYIIPARLEPCELPDELKPTQCVDLFDDDQWPQLIRSLHEGMRRLGKVLGAQPQPAPSRPSTGRDPIPYILLLSQFADKLLDAEKSDQSLDIPPLRTFRFETVKMNARGRIIERREGRAQYFVEDLGHGVALEMVEIPGGTFLMGTSETEARTARKETKRYGGSEDWIDREMPQHRVSVPPFFIGKFQITQAQWRTVARLPRVTIKLEPDPSEFKGDDLPVEKVSWEEAKEFCGRLSRVSQLKYRLPSEAEWEYACRAGTTTPFAFGETITPQIVNYNGEFPYAAAPKGENRKKTVPVGSLGVSNGFGLYDMHGNVWEWCEDVWHQNYNSAPADGSAWLSDGDSSNRVLRGGSWGVHSYNCRSAYSSNNQPDYRNNYIGLRVVVARAS